MTGHVWAWLQRQVSRGPFNPAWAEAEPNLPANHADALLAGVCRALLADGMLDAATLTHLLLNYAYEAHNSTHHPRQSRQASEAVLQAALRLHAMHDDPDEPDA